MRELNMEEIEAVDGGSPVTGFSWGLATGTVYGAMAYGTVAGATAAGIVFGALGFAGGVGYSIGSLGYQLFIESYYAN
jgi:hypothetical protein